MLRSLLVGVNGTEWSRNAVEFGLRCAQSANVPVTFFGVVDSSALTHAQAVPIGGSGFKAARDAMLVADARARVQEALESAAERARQQDVVFHTAITEGSPDAALGQEAQRHDLLIIGKRAIPQSDHDRPASSTMTHILRHAARPVIVAGPATRDAGEIVVAYDGSVQAARALGSFVLSGLHADAPVHVVGIGDDADGLRQILQRAENYLINHGRVAHSHVQTARDGIGASLTEFIQRTQPTLLVMGVYGEPRLKEFLFGSVTRSVLASVPVPLFLDH